MNEVPVCVEHKPFYIPDTLVGGSEKEREILFDMLGEYVMISADSHVESALNLCNQIKNTVAEVVVESPNKDRYLSPVHTPGKVIRDNVILDFAVRGLKYDETEAKKDEECRIDFEKKFTYGENFSPDDMREFFETAGTEVRRGSSVLMTGSVPVAPAFITAICLWGVVESLRYKKSPEAETIYVF